MASTGVARSRLVRVVDLCRRPRTPCRARHVARWHTRGPTAERRACRGGRAVRVRGRCSRPHREPRVPGGDDFSRISHRPRAPYVQLDDRLADAPLTGLPGWLLGDVKYLTTGGAPESFHL